MGASVQFVIVQVIKFASEECEESIILFSLRCEGAEYRLPHPHIRDAFAPNFGERFAFKTAP